MPPGNGPLNIPPRNYGANRSTPGKALQAWIHFRGFTEHSLEALQALQEAWLAEQPGPCTRVKWVPFVLLAFFPPVLQCCLLQIWPFSL